MVKIIGICGIGGSGKSTLTRELGKALQATTLYWDDFDEISRDPGDLIEWYHSSQNYDEWQYDELAKVLEKLKSGAEVISPATQQVLIPTEYIIFDAPLGRKHTATGQYIDFAIFLDTPLDIAMARRILRDYRDKGNLDVRDIFDELDFYVSTSRPLYTMHYTSQEGFDLVLDGSLSVDACVKTVIKKINSTKESIR